WSLADATRVEATSVGTLEPTANNPGTNIVAIDDIDPANGNYDFVLTTGVWDFNRFDFAFDSAVAGRTEN
ncbi:MAG: hypothetical protein GWO08_11655, partial [Gammaproteobacteria bacterium]|nr:hypothetical protein [Gammaproteobacteria bacterium]NIR94286.1 hypothetical protein [Gammaproteobacteria bacterium]